MYQTETAIQTAFAVYRELGRYRRSAESGSNVKEIKRILKNQKEDNVTDIDRTHTQEFMKFSNRYVMDLLGGDEENFITKTYKIVHDHACTDKELGLIAYLPVFYFRERDASIFRKQYGEYFSNSKHVHDHPFSGVVKIIRRVVTNNSPLYYADFQGNLLSFFSRNGEFKIGDQIQIKSARIKNHTQSKIIAHVSETQLSHIKVTV